MMPADAKSVLAYEQAPDGIVGVELRLDGRSVSGLKIFPLTVAIGVARVRVDGIGNVSTDDGYRGQGYARRVLDAAVGWMRRGEHPAPTGPAAFSFLFGIRNFYERFGYAPAGPEVSLRMMALCGSGPSTRELSVAGWRVRRCEPADLPTLIALYERSIAHSVAAVVRATDGRVWTTLASIAEDPSRDECRVVVDPSGAVVGYAWRGQDFWAVDTEDETPDALTIAEAVALEPASSDAVLAACRDWAVEESARRPQLTQVKVYLPPNGTLYAAAARQDTEAKTAWRATGEFMARTLDVELALRSVAAELTQRVRAARQTAAGTLRLETDAGVATLEIEADQVSVRAADNLREPPTATVELAQQDLTRLVLGTFPVDDALDRLSLPADPTARRWLEVLFPQRHPYVHPPDRI